MSDHVGQLWGNFQHYGGGYVGYQTEYRKNKVNGCQCLAMLSSNFHRNLMKLIEQLVYANTTL